jgi:hypothetical protein
MSTNGIVAIYNTSKSVKKLVTHSILWSLILTREFGNDDMSVRGCHHSTDAEACHLLSKKLERVPGRSGTTSISARGCHHSTTRTARESPSKTTKSKPPVIGTWSRPKTVMPLFHHRGIQGRFCRDSLPRYMVTIRSCVFRDRLLGRYPAGNSSL